MLVLEVHVMPKMKIEECVLEVHVTEMDKFCSRMSPTFLMAQK